MMFVCYTVAIGLVAFAHEQPDLFLLVAMLLAARRLLRPHR